MAVKSARFSGKAVLITGAASGLGQAAAVRLGSEGARLTLVDINESGLAETVAAVQERAVDAEAISVTADVGAESDVERYVAEAMSAYGRIDGFFNNAGIEGMQNLTEDFGSDEFDRVLAINLRGVFYGLKHVLKVMKNQSFGRVVNTASVGGIRGVGNQSGYAAAKHGVVGLTRNSGIEYGLFGVCINAIAPGAIMTPMIEGSLKQIDPDNWEQVGQEFVSTNPMQRFGSPEEVAKAVLFLAFDATYTTGFELVVDGGVSQL